MKSIFKSLFLLAATAFTFAACEDVPAPYALPGTDNNEGGDQPGTELAVGTGTLADPYNATAANAYIATLAADVESEQNVYVKGIISSIKENSNTQYGNAAFYISDDGQTSSEQFYVYRCYGLNNKKFTQDDMLNVGDEVIICGKVVNFKGNTPETVQNKAYIYSLNGQGGNGEGTGGTTPDTPSGEVKEITAAEALAILAGMDPAAQTTNEYIVSGKVESVTEISAQYGNATVVLEGGFILFRFKSFNGVNFTDENAIKAGDLVKVKGYLKNYVKDDVVTPELVNGTLVELNGKVDAGNDNPNVEPTGDNLLDNGDFETWNGNLPVNWKSACTASNATLKQSTDAHGGSYSVAVVGASSNKRLGYKELYLKAGTYTFTFYAKATTSDKCQCRPGYVPVTDGVVGSYAYGDYVGIKVGAWTEVKHTFTLDTPTTVCLVVMNPKGGTNYQDTQDILIDDASLVKE